MSIILSDTIKSIVLNAVTQIDVTLNVVLTAFSAMY
jgi:hypothetical protein